MPAITITEPLQINAIVWIHALEEDEMGPTRRTLANLRRLDQSGGLTLAQYAIRDRQELFTLLDDIAAQTASGLRPILHFDAHGNTDEGLCLAPSGEWASWAELIERLRAINLGTENNLVVVLALCFGLELYKLVELKRPAPAYLFAASDEVIYDDFLENQSYAFYKQVHEAGAFLEPFNRTLGRKMRLFNCQGLFLQALARYVKTQCRGQALDERIERSARKMLERAGVSEPTPQQLEPYRQRARAFLQPGENLIAHFAPTFLIGREPGFTYADVERLAR